MKDVQHSGHSAGGSTPHPRPSCAECRRLKVRCSRTVPCTSCLRRGCGNICPNGTLVTGEGHRAFWASTQELRTKLSELSDRIRDLEDALHGFSAHHPLLAGDLRKLKDPFLRDHEPDSPDEHEHIVKAEDEDGPLDAAGSLSVGANGRTAYIGHEANSWWFMHPSKDGGESPGEDGSIASLQCILPPQIFAATDAFPMSLVMPHLAGPIENRISSLCAYLPPVDHAALLRQHYYDYVSPVWLSIPYDEFNEHVFSPLYENSGWFSPSDPISTHRLALMFMVLALGSVMTPPSNSTDPEKYYRLACAAMMGSETAEHPSIEAIQALFLMSLYLYYYTSPSNKNMNMGFLINGMIVKLAHAIGLHRDPEKFHLDEKETHRRRLLMCFLYTWDLGAALTLSRPPTLTMPYWDIKIPYSDDSPQELMFQAWKFKFSKEYLPTVHHEVFGSSSPSYSAILRLDKKLRATPSPAGIQAGGDLPALVCQRHFAVIYRERVLLALHRGFFAYTIRNHADDPLKANYASSVIAACRSASMMITVSQQLYNALPYPTSKMWYVWNQVFSAAVILGTLVIHCPTLPFSQTAYTQLTTAYDLFSQLASNAAQTPLSVISKIRERAYMSLQEHGLSPSHMPAELPNGPNGYPLEDAFSSMIIPTRSASSLSNPSPPTSSPGVLSPHTQPPPALHPRPTSGAPSAYEYATLFASPSNGGSPNGGPPGVLQPGAPGPACTSAAASAPGAGGLPDLDLASFLQYYPLPETQEPGRPAFQQMHPAFSFPEQSSTLFNCNLQDVFEGWQP